MASLKEVRGRIVSVNSTQQITKAMKMVAAAKLKRAQDNIIKIRPYVQKLNGILSNISATMEDSVENPYSEQRTINKVLVVVIISDRGLAGAFNSNVIKNAVNLINAEFKTQKDQGNLEVMCIGKKGMDYFSKRGYKVIDNYVGLFHEISFDKVKGAAEYVMNAFLTKEYDRVDVVYNEFKNVATQIVRAKQFLPITEQPQANPEKAEKVLWKVDYIFEPSKEEIVKELIPKSLKIQFYEGILESNASEHGARMTAMDKATDNAKELLKELRLTYNRTRQAAITKEILEIVGGAEALNG